MQIDKKNLDSLKKVVGKYQDLFADVNAMNDILQAYRLEKPLSSIEIYEKEKKRVFKFAKELRQFFYTNFFTDLWDDEISFSGILFISRFSTLVEVAVYYDGLTDTFADLAGIIYGLSVNDVADYCLKWEERNPHSKLFK